MPLLRYSPIDTSESENLMGTRKRYSNNTSDLKINFLSPNSEICIKSITNKLINNVKDQDFKAKSELEINLNYLKCGIKRSLLCRRMCICIWRVVSLPSF
ncbi:hypothetical protein BpHYR1_012655 [Brachionus plicatilis]|uniref:Uncharacterized protein n=1 Tax=Brachionus plicatilis TaxID=10195 RepID=A0A3M7SVF6_BRAPC|nr:hypothetical protein BpHYR1_012655 [Brachionus plicatilis]